MHGSFCFVLPILLFLFYTLSLPSEETNKTNIKGRKETKGTITATQKRHACNNLIWMMELFGLKKGKKGEQQAN
jgi:hypothetical protein